MKFNIITIILVICAWCMMSSCATIICGSSQKVTFQCEEQADVYLNTELIGKTNEEIKIHRRSLNKLVTIRKEGYENYIFEMDIRFNYVVLIDAFCAIIPLTVDYAFGVQYKVDKEQKVNLKKQLTEVNK